MSVEQYQGYLQGVRYVGLRDGSGYVLLGGETEKAEDGARLAAAEREVSHVGPSRLVDVREPLDGVSRIDLSRLPEGVRESVSKSLAAMPARYFWVPRRSDMLTVVVEPRTSGKGAAKVLLRKAPNDPATGREVYHVVFQIDPSKTLESQVGAGELDQFHSQIRTAVVGFYRLEDEEYKRLTAPVQASEKPAPAPRVEISQEKTIRQPEVDKTRPILGSLGRAFTQWLNTGGRRRQKRDGLYLPHIQILEDRVTPSQTPANVWLPEAPAFGPALVGSENPGENAGEIYLGQAPIQPLVTLPVNNPEAGRLQAAVDTLITNPDFLELWRIDPAQINEPQVQTFIYGFALTLFQDGSPYAGLDDPAGDYIRYVVAPQKELAENAGNLARLNGTTENAIRDAFDFRLFQDRAAGALRSIVDNAVGTIYVPGIRDTAFRVDIDSSSARVFIYFLPSTDETVAQQVTHLQNSLARQVAIEDAAGPAISRLLDSGAYANSVARQQVRLQFVADLAQGEQTPAEIADFLNFEAQTDGDPVIAGPLKSSNGLPSTTGFRGSPDSFFYREALTRFVSGYVSPGVQFDPATGGFVHSLSPREQGQLFSTYASLTNAFETSYAANRTAFDATSRLVAADPSLDVQNLKIVAGYLYDAHSRPQRQYDSAANAFVDGPSPQAQGKTLAGFLAETAAFETTYAANKTAFDTASRLLTGNPSLSAAELKIVAAYLNDAYTRAQRQYDSAANAFVDGPSPQAQGKTLPQFLAETAAFETTYAANKTAFDTASRLLTGNPSLSAAELKIVAAYLNDAYTRAQRQYDSAANAFVDGPSPQAQGKTLAGFLAETAKFFENLSLLDGIYRRLNPTDKTRANQAFAAYGISTAGNTILHRSNYETLGAFGIVTPQSTRESLQKTVDFDVNVVRLREAVETSVSAENTAEFLRQLYGLELVGSPLAPQAFEILSRPSLGILFAEDGSLRDPQKVADYFGSVLQGIFGLEAVFREETAGTQIEIRNGQTAKVSATRGGIAPAFVNEAYPPNLIIAVNDTERTNDTAVLRLDVEALFKLIPASERATIRIRIALLADDGHTVYDHTFTLSELAALKDASGKAVITLGANLKLGGYTLGVQFIRAGHPAPEKFITVARVVVEKTRIATSTTSNPRGTGGFGGGSGAGNGIGGPGFGSGTGGGPVYFAAANAQEYAQPALREIPDEIRVRAAEEGMPEVLNVPYPDVPANLQDLPEPLEPEMTELPAAPELETGPALHETAQQVTQSAEPPSLGNPIPVESNWNLANFLFVAVGLAAFFAAVFVMFWNRPESSGSGASQPFLARLRARFAANFNRTRVSIALFLVAAGAAAVLSVFPLAKKPAPEPVVQMQENQDWKERNRRKVAEHEAKVEAVRAENDKKAKAYQDELARVRAANIARAAVREEIASREAANAQRLKDAAALLGLIGDLRAQAKQPAVQNMADLRAKLKKATDQYLALEQESRREAARDRSLIGIARDVARDHGVAEEEVVKAVNVDQLTALVSARVIEFTRMNEAQLAERAIERRAAAVGLARQEETEAAKKSAYDSGRRNVTNQNMVSVRWASKIRPKGEGELSYRFAGRDYLLGPYRVSGNGPESPYDSFLQDKHGNILERFRGFGGPEEARAGLAGARYRYDAGDGKSYGRFFDALVVDSDNEILFAWRMEYGGGKRTLVIFPGTMSVQEIEAHDIIKMMRRETTPLLVSGRRISEPMAVRMRQIQARLTALGMPNDLQVVNHKTEGLMVCHLPGPDWMVGDVYPLFPKADGFYKYVDRNYSDSTGREVMMGFLEDASGRPVRIVAGTELTQRYSEMFGGRYPATYQRVAPGSSTFTPIPELYERIVREGGLFQPNPDFKALEKLLGGIRFEDMPLLMTPGQEEVGRKWVEKRLEELRTQLAAIPSEQTEARQKLIDEMDRVQRSNFFVDGSNLMWGYKPSLATAEKNWRESAEATEVARLRDRQAKAPIRAYFQFKVQYLPQNDVAAFDREAKALLTQAKNAGVEPYVQGLIEDRRRQLQPDLSPKPLSKKGNEFQAARPAVYELATATQPELVRVLVSAVVRNPDRRLRSALESTTDETRLREAVARVVLGDIRDPKRIQSEIRPAISRGSAKRSRAQRDRLVREAAAVIARAREAFETARPKDAARLAMSRRQFLSGVAAGAAALAFGDDLLAQDALPERTRRDSAFADTEYRGGERVAIEAGTTVDAAVTFRYSGHTYIPMFPQSNVDRFDRGLDRERKYQEPGPLGRTPMLHMDSRGRIVSILFLNRSGEVDFELSGNVRLTYKTRGRADRTVRIEDLELDEVRGLLREPVNADTLFHADVVTHYQRVPATSVRPTGTKTYRLNEAGQTGFTLDQFDPGAPARQSRLWLWTEDLNQRIFRGTVPAGDGSKDTWLRSEVRTYLKSDRGEMLFDTKTGRPLYKTSFEYHDALGNLMRQEYERPGGKVVVDVLYRAMLANRNLREETGRRASFVWGEGRDQRSVLSTSELLERTDAQKNTYVQTDVLTAEGAAIYRKVEVYDKMGNLIRQEIPAEDGTIVIDILWDKGRETGRAAHFVRGGFRTRLSEGSFLTHDPSGNSHVSIRHFDASGNVFSRTTELYDPVGNLVRQVIGVAGEGTVTVDVGIERGRETGRRESFTDTENNTTLISTGRLLRFEGPARNMQAVVDIQDEITHVSRQEYYNPVGWLKKQLIRNAENRFFNLIEVSFADGRETGRVRWATDRAGVKIPNRPPTARGVFVRQQSGENVVDITEDNRTVRNYLDVFGRVLRKEKPGGVIERFTYERLRRLTSTRMVYVNPATRLETTIKTGSIVGYVTASGHFIPANEADAYLRGPQAQGRLVGVRGSVTQVRTNKLHYEDYDFYGAPLRVLTPALNGREVSVRTFRYDAQGDLTGAETKLHAWDGTRPGAEIRTLSSSTTARDAETNLVVNVSDRVTGLEWREVLDESGRILYRIGGPVRNGALVPLYIEVPSYEGLLGAYGYGSRSYTYVYDAAKRLADYRPQDAVKEGRMRGFYRRDGSYVDAPRPADLAERDLADMLHVRYEFTNKSTGSDWEEVKDDLGRLVAKIQEDSGKTFIEIPHYENNLEGERGVALTSALYEYVPGQKFADYRDSVGRSYLTRPDGTPRPTAAGVFADQPISTYRYEREYKSGDVSFNYVWEEIKDSSGNTLTRTEGYIRNGAFVPAVRRYWFYGGSPQIEISGIAVKTVLTVFDQNGANETMLSVSDVTRINSTDGTLSYSSKTGRVNPAMQAIISAPGSPKTRYDELNNRLDELFARDGFAEVWDYWRELRDASHARVKVAMRGFTAAGLGDNDMARDDATPRFLTFFNGYAPDMPFVASEAVMYDFDPAKGYDQAAYRGSQHLRRAHGLRVRQEADGTPTATYDIDDRRRGRELLRTETANIATGLPVSSVGEFPVISMARGNLGYATKGMQTTTFSYLGRPIEVHDSQGRIRRHNYDFQSYIDRSTGRMMMITHYDGTEGNAPNLFHRYRQVLEDDTLQDESRVDIIDEWRDTLTKAWPWLAAAGGGVAAWLALGQLLKRSRSSMPREATVHSERPAGSVVPGVTPPPSSAPDTTPPADGAPGTTGARLAGSSVPDGARLAPVDPALLPSFNGYGFADRTRDAARAKFAAVIHRMERGERMEDIAPEYFQEYRNWRTHVMGETTPFTPDREDLWLFFLLQTGSLYFHNDTTSGFFPYLLHKAMQMRRDGRQAQIGGWVRIQAERWYQLVTQTSSIFKGIGPFGAISHFMPWQDLFTLEDLDDMFRIKGFVDEYDRREALDAVDQTDPNGNCVQYRDLIARLRAVVDRADTGLRAEIQRAMATSPHVNSPMAGFIRVRLARRIMATPAYREYYDLIRGEWAKEKPLMKKTYSDKIDKGGLGSDALARGLQRFRSIAFGIVLPAILVLSVPVLGILAAFGVITLMYGVWIFAAILAVHVVLRAAVDFVLDFGFTGSLHVLRNFFFPIMAPLVVSAASLLTVLVVSYALPVLTAVLAFAAILAVLYAVKKSLDFYVDYGFRPLPVLLVPFVGGLLVAAAFCALAIFPALAGLAPLAAASLPAVKGALFAFAVPSIPFAIPAAAGLAIGAYAADRGINRLYAPTEPVRPEAGYGAEPESVWQRIFRWSFWSGIFGVKFAFNAIVFHYVLIAHFEVAGAAWLLPVVGGAATLGMLWLPIALFSFLDTFSFLYLGESLVGYIVGKMRGVGRVTTTAEAVSMKNELVALIKDHYLPAELNLTGRAANEAIAEFVNTVILEVICEEDMISASERDAMRWAVAPDGNLVVPDAFMGQCASPVMHDRLMRFFSQETMESLTRVPSWDKIRSLTTMIPVGGADAMAIYPYDENMAVPAAEEGLRLDTPQNSGFSPLNYLIDHNREEWANFCDRMLRDGLADADLAHRLRAHALPGAWGRRLGPLPPALEMQVRLWASYRFQPFSRTLQGLMHYPRMLRFQARLHSRANGLGWDEARVRQEVSSKYQILWAHQDYGNLIAQRTAAAAAGAAAGVVATGAQADAKLRDVDYLITYYMNREGFPIDLAYIVNRGGTFYCGLARPDASGAVQMDVELIDVGTIFPLPGEGKPGNQANARRFARGECVMTFDVNQDFYAEQACKIPMLLALFDDPDVAIVGYPEHIFTHNYSVIGWAHALADRTFNSLVGDMLTLQKVRFHYGHPDIWRASFIDQFGGVSATPTVNEDIQAGKRLKMRGKKILNVGFIEAGKAREGGNGTFDGISRKFGMGASEQQMRRLDHRLNTSPNIDLPQQLSHFYAGIGFFTRKPWATRGNMVYLFALLLLGVSSFSPFPMSLVFAMIGIVVLSQAITSTGLAQYISERPFWPALGVFLLMFFLIAPFFMSHVFTYAVGVNLALVGIAWYVGTGRGFQLEHAPLTSVLMGFAKSHSLPGILGVGMALTGIAIWLNLTLLFSAPPILMALFAIMIPFLANRGSHPFPGLPAGVSPGLFLTLFRSDFTAGRNLVVTELTQSWTNRDYERLSDALQLSAAFVAWVVIFGPLYLATRIFFRPTPLPLTVDAVKTRLRTLFENATASSIAGFPAAGVAPLASFDAILAFLNARNDQMNDLRTTALPLAGPAERLAIENLLDGIAAVRADIAATQAARLAAPSRFLSAVILALALIFSLPGALFGEVVKLVTDTNAKTAQVEIGGKKMKQADLVGVVYQPAGNRHVSYYTNGRVHELVAHLLPANDPLLKELGLSKLGEDHGRVMTREMGIKNIRLYYLPLDDEKDIDKTKRILRRANELYGIRVMAGHWAGLWDVPGSPDLKTDTPAGRKAVKDSVVRQVKLYAAEPWLLFWQIGNEENYHVKGGRFNWKVYPMNLTDYYAFRVELAAAIKAAEKTVPNASHPVLLGNGGLTAQEARLIKEANKDGAIDALGLNLYPGVEFFGGNKGFRGSAAELKGVFERAHGAGLPVVISETGLWALDKAGQEEQKKYYDALKPYLVGNGWVPSFFAFAFTNEGWKIAESGRKEEGYFGIEGTQFHDKGAFKTWFSGEKPAPVEPKKTETKPVEPVEQKSQEKTQEKKDAETAREEKKGPAAVVPAGDERSKEVPVWVLASVAVVSVAGFTIVAVYLLAKRRKPEAAPVAEETPTLTPIADGFRARMAAIARRAMAGEPRNQIVESAAALLQEVDAAVQGLPDTAHPAERAALAEQQRILRAHSGRQSGARLAAERENFLPKVILVTAAAPNDAALVDGLKAYYGVSGEAFRVVTAADVEAYVASQPADGAVRIVLDPESFAADNAPQTVQEIAAVLTAYMQKKTDVLTTLQKALLNLDVDDAEIRAASQAEIAGLIERLAPALPGVTKMSIRVTGGQTLELRNNGRSVRPEEIAASAAEAYAEGDVQTLSKTADLIVDYVSEKSADAVALYSALMRAIQNRSLRGLEAVAPETGRYDVVLHQSAFEVRGLTADNVLQAVENQKRAVLERVSRQAAGRNVQVRFLFAATDAATLALVQKHFDDARLVSSGVSDFRAVTAAFGAGTDARRIVIGRDSSVTAEALSQDEYLMDVVPDARDFGGTLVAASAIVLSRGRAMLPGVSGMGQNRFRFKPFSAMVGELLAALGVERKAVETAA